MSKASPKVPVTALRPEAEILLHCARTCFDSERADLIRALVLENVDWTYLIRTASRHGIMPLLSWSLSTVYSEAVPKDVLNKLRNYLHCNARRNLFLAGELLNVLRLFETNNISAIPFKGPTLAASAYGNLALRVFGDLDILIPKKDVLRAKNLLVSQGYWPTLQFNRAQESAQLQSSYEYGLVRRDGNIELDLHWGTTKGHFPLPLDIRSLCERLEPVSLAGAKVLTLSPEDLLLVLCMHGSKHLWERLGWICDIGELIRANQRMDWKRVMEQATTHRSKRMLLLGLFLAHDLLGTRLPDEVLQPAQSDSVIPTLARRVRERLFQERPGPLSHSEQYSFYLKAREQLRDRVQFCLSVSMIPAPADYALVQLPSQLFFLYYLIRPLRMIGKYGLTPLKHLPKITRTLLGSR